MADRSRIILLAEDEEIIREMSKMMLEHMGFEVFTAADGAEAVEIFRQKDKEIACVLCDLTMPRMDGWATLGAIRQICPDTPVILTSGYDEATVMAGDQTVLPDVFIQKPYESSNLKAVLGKVIE